jgi:hypothetical protein
VAPLVMENGTPDAGLREQQAVVQLRPDARYED